MNALPIVHRELLLAARRRATFVSRSVVAGIVILLWLVITGATARYLSTSELAKQLFWTYGILAMLYAVLCGVFFTADALSAERREGTLGLLFLTDLKGHDVVLGKLVATSWYGFHVLLVILPILTLPLLMGGVSGDEMGRFLILMLLTIMNLVFACVLLGFDPPGMRNDRWWVAEIFVWGTVVLWLDGHALMHAGMFTGLKARSHHKAALGTVLRVLVPPWAGVVLFFLFIMLPGGLTEAGFVFCMNGWFVLCALLDVVLILHMKTMLEANLRRLCAGEQLAYGGPLAEPPLTGEPSPA
jgi:ABC-type transport system involved in cytochrome c biogenesis permease component